MVETRDCSIIILSLSPLARSLARSFVCRSTYTRDDGGWSNSRENERMMKMDDSCSSFLRHCWFDDDETRRDEPSFSTFCYWFEQYGKKYVDEQTFFFLPSSYCMQRQNECLCSSLSMVISLFEDSQIG